MERGLAVQRNGQVRQQGGDQQETTLRTPAKIGNAVNAANLLERRERVTAHQPCKVAFLAQATEAVHAFSMKKP